MAYMQKIMSGVKVDHLLAEIEAHPELFNRYTMRTDYAGSAHESVDDIFLRYNDYSNFDIEHPELFSDAHESVWYSAAHLLPSVKETIEQIFALSGGEELGGALITRLKPGCSVKPHADSGWHVNHYLSKYLLILQADKGQTFEFGEEKHEGKAGDLYIFDNRAEHAVYNRSDVDRISLILAIRQKGHDHE